MADIQTGSHNPRALRAGTELRSYIIERTLGAGGFGITYLARHKQFEKNLVAIKEYMPKDVAYRDEEQELRLETESQRGDFKFGLDSFYREAQNLHELTRRNHPSLENVVNVKDVYEHNKTAYMEMEYVDGDSLESMIGDMARSDEKLSEERLLDLFGQIAGAIDFMHSRGLLHRDVTPSNVIVRRDNQKPVLIDFGSAKSQNSHTQTGARGSIQTQYTRVVFTPGYAPLEQSEGLEQDARTDIYGLAATMYHLALRKKPAPAATRRIAMEEQGKPDPLIPAVVAGKDMDYSTALLEAIDAGLGLRVRDRPDTVQQWLKPLNLLEANGPVERTPDGPVEPVSRPPFPKKLAAAGAGALLAIVAIVIGLQPSVDEILVEARQQLVSTPFDPTAVAQARERFLKAQLDSDGLPAQVDQATAGVAVTDLLARYRESTNRGDIDEARTHLNGINAQAPLVGLAPEMAQKVQSDFNFESGLEELREVLRSTGLGTDLATDGVGLIGQMRPAGEGDPRFASAESTLTLATEAAEKLQQNQFALALTALDEATSASDGMGEGTIAFTGARGVVAESRRIYVDAMSEKAAAALVAGSTDPQVLSQVASDFDEALRVDKDNAMAKAGRAVTQSLQRLLADLPSTSPEPLIDDVQALAPTARDALISESDWGQVVLAYRDAQQGRRLSQVRQSLSARALDTATHSAALSTLDAVDADVTTHPLSAPLADQARAARGAVTSLQLIRRRMDAHEYAVAETLLVGGTAGSSIRSSDGGDDIHATATTALAQALTTEISTRWSAAQTQLSEWRAPASPRTLSAPLQRVLALDADEPRASVGKELLAPLSALSQQVSKHDYKNAYDTLDTIVEAANRLELADAFVADNLIWLRDRTEAHVGEQLDNAYKTLLAAPTVLANHERVEARLVAADELIALTTRPIEDTSTLRAVMAPLIDIPAALDGGSFSQAEARAAQSLGAITSDRFDAGLLKTRLDAQIAKARAEFRTYVTKKVAETSTAAFNILNKAPIDLETIAQAQLKLDDLDKLRSNPEVQFDWTTVLDIDTSISALTQSRNIADSHDFLSASTTLAETSVALESEPRWRGLLMKGVSELEKLKKTTTAALLTEAGARLNETPFAPAAWAASTSQYEIVKTIEASEEGQGALGLAFIDLLKEVADPIQNEDTKWMFQNSDKLKDQRTKFARLPSALKILVRLDRQVREHVKAKEEKWEGRVADVFNGIAYNDDTPDMYAEKLGELEEMSSQSAQEGVTSVVTIAQALQSRLQRMDKLARHLQNKELAAAKTLAKTRVGDEGLEALSEAQRTALKQAEAGLAKAATAREVRARLGINNRLMRAFEQLSADPLNPASIKAAQEIVEEALSVQVDSPDALTAREFLSALERATGAQRCDGLSSAAAIAKAFRHPTYNLSWLDPLLEEC